jgi:N-acetylmuramoyl-L-alanine amidase
MDKSLLKKAAIQSLALMIAVITFSYALKQYQTVTIAASGKTIEVTTVRNNSGGNDKLTTLENNQTDGSDAKLTDIQKLVGGADQNILNKLGDNYIVIKKPQGDHLSLNLEDIYIKKSICLTIKGISVNDLNSSMISRVNGDEIFTGEPKFTESSSVEADEDDGSSKEMVNRDYGDDFSRGITITTEQDNETKQYTSNVFIELNSVYAYFVYEASNYYFIDLRKPSDVYDKILVIDAGHGGKDAGALSRNETYYEKNINLGILLDLKKLLDKENIKVYYTRTSDETVFLRPRVELANAVDCDYFISIHCNANEVSYPNGTEVLFYNNKFKGVKSLDLAKIFSNEVSKAAALKDRGTVEKHKDDIFIMDKAEVPMILIETGYVTNSGDMYYLSREEGRKAVAKGIYNGIMRAFKELPADK